MLLIKNLNKTNFLEILQNSLNQIWLGRLSCKVPSCFRPLPPFSLTLTSVLMVRIVEVRRCGFLLSNLSKTNISCTFNLVGLDYLGEKMKSSMDVNQTTFLALSKFSLSSRTSYPKPASSSSSDCLPSKILLLLTSRGSHSRRKCVWQTLEPAHKVCN